MSQRMPENEKVIWVCLLFPLFWPFLPAILICMACDKIRSVYQGWEYRMAERRAIIKRHAHSTGHQDGQKT